MSKPRKKIVPEKTLHFQGRKVLYMICEALESDTKKRVNNMHKKGNHNRTPVVRIGKISKNRVIYKSMTEAGKHLNLCPSQISKACKNGSSCGGYHWKKVKDDT